MKQKNDVHVAWPWRWRSHAWRWPLVVTLTRISRAGVTGWKPLDDDNLRASFKWVRDQVAAELGADDGDRSRVRWEYGEAEGPWGVRIQIQEARHG